MRILSHIRSRRTHVNVAGTGALLLGLALTPTAGIAASPGRDLVVSALSPRGSLVAGSSLTATVTTRNIGSRRASGSSTHVYLSRDRRLSADDRRLGGALIPALDPGQSVTRTIKATIPATTPAAGRVVACADDGHVIGESNEANNCRATPDEDNDGWANFADCAPRNAGVNPGINDKPDIPGSRDTNCDGIDGTARRAVFVSPIGSDAAAGGKSSPKRTLGAAVSTAASQGKSVYATFGTYTERLVMRNGVGVYGGYDTAWKRSLTNRTRITGATVSGRTEGALAVDLTSRTGLQHLALVPPGATTASGSSYGLRAVGSPGLVIERLIATGGAGAGGTRGSNGTVGSPGRPGANGKDNTGCFNNGTPGAGGAGGSSPAGRTGGQGGTGGDQGDNDGHSGATGRLTSPDSTGRMGGPGGPGGSGGDTGGEGGRGSDADTGVIGPEGSGGFGGAVLGGLWRTSRGLRGLNGAPGHGGGGGGGGGGENAILPFDESPGNGGGGGGGGGAGGGAGAGGGGGGGSFGAFFANSMGAVLRDSTITARDGGSGASGGSGAFGGGGGSGGFGSARCSALDDGQGGVGGDGGRGGFGGLGGAGGGGAGGPSIGLYLEDTTVTEARNTVAHGSGGAAGLGAGASGGAGQAADRN